MPCARRDSAAHAPVEPAARPGADGSAPEQAGAMRRLPGTLADLGAADGGRLAPPPRLPTAPASP